MICDYNFRQMIAIMKSTAHIFLVQNTSNGKQCNYIVNTAEDIKELWRAYSVPQESGDIWKETAVDYF